MTAHEFGGAEFSADDRILLERVSTGSAGHADLETETASAYLTAIRVPQNSDFARACGRVSGIRGRNDLRVGLVPGAFHGEHQHTGADGRMVKQVLAQLGQTVEAIPVKSFGSCAENAQLILHWLALDPSRPVILISLSKGACDIKAALKLIAGRPHLPMPRIAAWISLSGISTGTPLVRWLKDRPWRWAAVWLILKLRGQRISVLHDLGHRPNEAWPPLPEAMQLIHVHGFPLGGHLRHPWAPKAYQRLASLGANDGGGVLLKDVIHWPGVVVPLWGVDHYMAPEHDISERLKQVFQVVLARTA